MERGCESDEWVETFEEKLADCVRGKNAEQSDVGSLLKDF